MKNIIIIAILSFLITSGAYAQSEKHMVLYARVVDGDTVPIVPLKQVTIVSLRIIDSKRDARRYSKLVRNVKKVYPYAKLAGIKLREYEELLLAAANDKERRQLMKQAEEELKEEYEDDLRKMTFSQGRILIKLVDRETGNSSYELVQELRGNFMAFFWQTFARIFGYDLKVRYDPEGEDKEIENIVRLIESGQI